VEYQKPIRSLSESDPYQPEGDTSVDLARRGMPEIASLSGLIREGSPEFQEFAADLQEDLHDILGPYVHNIEISERGGRLRIKCELLPDVASSASEDIERLVRRIANPMPVEFQVINPQAGIHARKELIVPDWQPREHQNGGARLSPLEEDVRMTLPVGIDPIQITPFTLDLYDDVMRGVHVTARVPTGLEDIAEHWRKEFESVHDVRVHLRKEWVRQGLERSLERIAGKGTLLTDEHIPAIQSQLRRWFDKAPPEPLPKFPPSDVLQDAEDLRSLPFVTIDQQGTKNPEDAVCAVPSQDRSIDLYVGVADVSWAVRPNSANDDHFAARAVSIYSGKAVFPLMGRQFALNQGSLLQGQERLAWVFRFNVSDSGEIVSADFGRARIQVSEALTPEQVGDRGKDSASLGLLLEATERLRNRDGKSGSFVLGDLSKPGRHVVDQCMRTLYAQAGCLLAQMGSGGLFTTYQVPSEKQLTILMRQMEKCGVPVSSSDFSTAQDFSRLWDRLAQSNDAPPALLAETLDRFFPRSMVGTVPDVHNGVGATGGYSRIKADSYIGLVNQWMLESVLDGVEPPFSAEQLARIARQQNRKRSSVDAMGLQVRFMSMLSRNLHRVGNDMSVEVSRREGAQTFIRVQDNWFSKEAILSQGRGYAEGDLLRARLAGFDMKKGCFVFEPENENWNKARILLQPILAISP
jgi:hypothetical protein